MESTQAPVRYVILTKVIKVLHGDTGYFVQFHGSHESLYLGHDKPSFEHDDYIRITIEKVQA